MKHSEKISCTPKVFMSNFWGAASLGRLVGEVVAAGVVLDALKADFVVDAVVAVSVVIVRRHAVVFYAGVL